MVVALDYRRDRPDGAGLGDFDHRDVPTSALADELFEEDPVPPMHRQWKRISPEAVARRNQGPEPMRNKVRDGDVGLARGPNAISNTPLLVMREASEALPSVSPHQAHQQAAHGDVRRGRENWTAVRGGAAAIEWGPY